MGSNPRLTNYKSDSLHTLPLRTFTEPMITSLILYTLCHSARSLNQWLQVWFSTHSSTPHVHWTNDYKSDSLHTAPLRTFTEPMICVSLFWVYEIIWNLLKWYIFINKLIRCEYYVRSYGCHHDRQRKTRWWKFTGQNSLFYSFPIVKPF